MSQRLIIIGAGPKAIAIGAKASVLAEIGMSVPQVVILEKSEVAANWTGQQGFTDGTLRLGTPPEKDVGFPYRSKIWGEHGATINTLMTGYSWNSFLLDRGAYSDWVDRGKPAPCHREWANYLKWVAARLHPSVQIRRGRVCEVRLGEGGWNVRFAGTDGQCDRVEGDGLVLTGPGKSSLPRGSHGLPNVLTIENFWENHRHGQSLRGKRVLIAGCGETAAALALVLSRPSAGVAAIEILSPKGMVFSRGESYFENRVYSAPAENGWAKLSQSDRREFIYRTDRGVFSQDIQDALRDHERIAVRAGRVNSVVEEIGGQVRVEWDYNGSRGTDVYDFLLLATGTEPLSNFRDLVPATEWPCLEDRFGINLLNRSEVESRVGFDLALVDSRPKLHVPMLAGLSQGPGFANLSCLGDLSDRILSSYVGGI